MRDVKKTAVIHLLTLVTLFVSSLLAAIPVWLLWNVLMPEMFGFKSIGFWQALCLILLFRAIFKDIPTLTVRVSSK
jgi:hypothetical protein